MKNDLLKHSISEAALVFDAKGLRTWDSVRNLKVRNIDHVIFISQKFHLERALFISKKHNVSARAFVAKGATSFKMFIREILARVKMELDIVAYHLNNGAC